MTFRFPVCLVLFLLLTALARANLPDVSAPATSPAPSVLSSAQDFLPVREAYPVSLEVTANQLQVSWHVTPGYFLYGDKFRVTVVAPTVTAPGQTQELALQRETGEITFDEYFQKEVEKFHADITVTAQLPEPTDSAQLDLDISYQGCADAGLCYPPETLHYRIDRGALTATEIEAAPPPVIDPPAAIAVPPASFALMLLFAVIGGLLLNLMPCVFPVLTLKLLSFARSNQSESHVREHSWYYTAGVLTTFAFTALLLMVLRQSGAMLGWGYQLQSPWFVAALALLFLLLALSMSGFITIGTRLMGVGQQLTDGHLYRHSFFTGMLAVVVASPCSVPFMGVALGYALTQPLWGALVIFLGLGFGLAVPFLIFAYWPWLVQHLPKPGAWMEMLKHWLALPLYLSALWLLWVLWHQIATPVTTPSLQGQEKYSAQTLTHYRNRHDKVFVELTADWCITCLVNEKTSLSRPAVTDAMKQHNIHYLRGDWTNRDPEITDLLKQHQRAGVPLYLYYDAEGNLTILPQILTEQIVLDAFNR